jgi:hypothetical protein
LTGTRSVVFGRISVGSEHVDAERVRLAVDANHCTPMARPGMRFAAASSGRRKVATT